MRRKSFGALAGVAGLVLAVTLGIAGGLLTWGSAYIHNTVHNQLAAQQIYFPAAAAFAHAKAGTEITPGMIPSISQYAGQQMLTGQQAEAYADHFIAVHIAELGAGKTYSQLSAEAIAQPNNTKLAATVATVFKGDDAALHAAERLRLVEGIPDHVDRRHHHLRPGRPVPDRLRNRILAPPHQPRTAHRPATDSPGPRHRRLTTTTTPTPATPNQPAPNPAPAGYTFPGRRNRAATPDYREHSQRYPLRPLPIGTGAPAGAPPASQQTQRRSAPRSSPTLKLRSAACRAISVTMAAPGPGAGFSATV